MYINILLSTALEGKYPKVTAALVLSLSLLQKSWYYLLVIGALLDLYTLRELSLVGT